VINQNNILSEVTRVREIMGLREQRKKTIITNTIKSDVDVPIPPIKGNYGVGESNPTKFIVESVDTIMNSLPQKAKNMLVEGELQLVQITVKAGASNYWDSTTGPTQFDHEIVGDEYIPTTDGKGKGLSKDGYDLNMELAELRASTYIEKVKPLLEAEGVVVGDKLSQIPQGMVVYTGGKNDKPTCTTDCGQVLILTLSFIYTNTIEKTIDVCLPEIQITIGVQGVAVDEHECDEAIFKVSVNGAKIGIANLNNGVLDRYIDGGGWSKMKNTWPKRQLGALQGKAQESWYSNLPGRKSPGRETDKVQGGVRSWTTMIDTEDEKFNWGKENILEITPLVFNKGKKSYVKLKDGTEVQLCGPQAGFRPCGSHSEVPKVTIKNTPETAGQFATVYDAQPNIGKLTFGSTETTELLRLDNCGVPIETETVSTEG
tara:strand:- start:1772 stop:3061 length:1290 start_codon:yes stop_codon:yes gene_type:complete